jgi:hypothetical protein
MIKPYVKFLVVRFRIRTNKPYDEAKLERRYLPADIGLNFDHQQVQEQYNFRDHGKTKPPQVGVQYLLI